MLALPPHGAQAVARRPGGGVAIGHAGADIVHAGAGVEREHVDAGVLADHHHDAPAAPVLEQVGGQLGHHQREPALQRGIDARRVGQCCCPPPRFRDLARVRDPDIDRGGHFQRAMRMRVPLPGADSMANSLDSRLAPPSPRPSPPPVV